MNPEHRPSALKSVLTEIRAAYGMLHATGAVDSESRDLQTIEQELLSGRIDPDEALQKVRNMLDSRQNYH